MSITNLLAIFCGIFGTQYRKVCILFRNLKKSQAKVKVQQSSYGFLFIPWCYYQPKQCCKVDCIQVVKKKIIQRYNSREFRLCRIKGIIQYISVLSQRLYLNGKVAVKSSFVVTAADQDTLFPSLIVGLCERGKLRGLNNIMKLKFSR